MPTCNRKQLKTVTTWNGEARAGHFSNIFSDHERREVSKLVVERLRHTIEDKTKAPYWDEEH
jgi:hypothetical protein